MTCKNGQIETVWDSCAKVDPEIWIQCKEEDGEEEVSVTIVVKWLELLHFIWGASVPSLVLSLESNYLVWYFVWLIFLSLSSEYWIILKTDHEHTQPYPFHFIMHSHLPIKYCILTNYVEIKKVSWNELNLKSSGTASLESNASEFWDFLYFVSLYP